MSIGFGELLAAGIITALVSSAANYAATTTENKKTYKRQKALANTAHRREVDDLKAAGLNPLLSAGGGGASVAYSAQSVNPGLDLASPVMDAFKTANEGERTDELKKQVAMQQAQQESIIHNNSAQAQAAQAQAQAAQAQAEQAKAQAKINESKAARESYLTDAVSRDPFFRYRYLSKELLDDKDDVPIFDYLRKGLEGGYFYGKARVSPVLQEIYDQMRDPNVSFGFRKGEGQPNSAQKVNDINNSERRSVIEHSKESKKANRPVNSPHYQHVKERAYD